MRSIVAALLGMAALSMGSMNCSEAPTSGSGGGRENQDASPPDPCGTPIVVPDSCYSDAGVLSSDLRVCAQDADCSFITFPGCCGDDYVGVRADKVSFARMCVPGACCPAGLGCASFPHVEVDDGSGNRGFDSSSVVSRCVPMMDGGTMGICMTAWKATP